MDGRSDAVATRTALVLKVIMLGQEWWSPRGLRHFFLRAREARDLDAFRKLKAPQLRAQQALARRGQWHERPKRTGGARQRRL